MNKLRKGILTLLLASLALCSGAFALFSLNSNKVALAENNPGVSAVDESGVQILDVNNLCNWVGKTKTPGGDTYGEPFSLINASVYVYSRIGDETNLDAMRYSLNELTDDEISKGYRLAYVANANNAVARNRGGEITVDLEIYSQYKDVITYDFENIEFEGSAQSPGVNSSPAMGPHNALVMISCAEGYAFYNYDTSSSGILISTDRRTALISKEWYIVEVGNPLVFAPEQTEDGAVPDDTDPDFWNINGWTYNTLTENTAAPVLMYSDDSAEWNVNNEVKFDLINNDNNSLAEYGITLGKLNEYINKSMPAGNYSAIFHVPSVTHETIIYNGYTETYSFTVSPAEFKAEWREDAQAKLKDISYEAIRRDGEYVFQLYGKDDNAASTVDLLVWSDFSSSPFNPAREGIWANEKYDNYYSDRYYLTYNLDRLQNNTYLTYAAMSQFNTPAAPDTYTVYYQLQANNYEPLTSVMNDTERRSYKFTLLIYEILSEPVLDRLIFNNTVQLISGTNRYEVMPDADDTYTDVGDHTVTLKSLDGKHYVWKQGNELVGEIRFTYKITRVDNTENQELYLPNWEWNGYDPTVKPAWGTEFIEDGSDDFFSFILQSDDGTFYEQSDFGKAPVGTYTLIATAKGYVEGDETTAHYNWNQLTSTATIHITKAANDWYVTPDVIQWQYKGFNADTNHFLAAAKYSRESDPVLFSVATDEEGKNIIDGLKEFTADSQNKITDQKVIDKLTGLDAGVYYLITSVKGTDDYSGLNPQPHRFEVNVADNAWTEKLSISTWISGKYNAEENLIVAAARFGEAHFRIVNAEDNTKVIYDDKNGIDELASAPVGNYILTVEIADDVKGNFKGISDFLQFRIFEKPGLPWWVTVIIVAGALGAAALVMYILHQKGVLQLLTGRIVVAMRTKATVDATIAAIRANKVAENARKTVALAEEQDKLEQTANDKNKNAPKDE